MKASEVIAILQQIVKEKGDVDVYSGGEDYPDEVSSIEYVERGKGNAYVPSGSIHIWA